MSKTQFIELLEKQEEAENRLKDDEPEFGPESNSFGPASSQGGESGQFPKFRQSMPKMSSAKSMPRLSGASRRATSFVSKMNRDGNPVQPNSFNSRDALLLEYKDSKGSPSYLDQEAKMSFEGLKQVRQTKLTFRDATEVKHLSAFREVVVFWKSISRPLLSIMIDHVG